MIDDTLQGVPVPATLPISRTDNPFWDIMRTLPGDTLDWKFYRTWSPNAFAAFSQGMKISGKLVDRHDLCHAYAWAIPDPDALDFAAKHLSSKAVEMGAGLGYWAWQLSQLGVDMLAFDEKPPDVVTDNHWCSPRAEHHGELLNTTCSTYFPVQPGTPDILSQHEDRTLFLCWPPYDTDMAAQCLTIYPGRNLVYIGEYAGGCTGDDAFFKMLDAQWEERASHPIVQWWGINDVIQVYERKKESK